MNRQRFDISVSGGVAAIDTGPNTFGEIRQMRWVHAADTGQVATLQLGVYPDQSDTGLGWLFYSAAAANLATQFTKVPYQPVHGSDGNVDPADTGSQVGVPVVMAGDRIRVIVTPSDTGVVLTNGRLYIWTKD